MKDILLQTYVIALPVVLGYVVWLLKKQNSTRDENAKKQTACNQAIVNGLKVLLRIQLIEYHTKWMKRGYVTKHGLENFLEIYAAYHALGGNGVGTHMKNDIEELPIGESGDEHEK